MRSFVTEFLTAENLKMVRVFDWLLVIITIVDLRQKKGDIVNLDVSLYINGFHSDVNATFPVGEIDPQSKVKFLITFSLCCRFLSPLSLVFSFLVAHRYDT